MFFLFFLCFHNHFPKIHRSALHKITIDLLYFWDVCDINLWGKSFNGKSTAYSCRTNVFIYFRYFMEKRDFKTGVFLWNLWNFQGEWWWLLKTPNILLCTKKYTGHKLAFYSTAFIVKPMMRHETQAWCGMTLRGTGRQQMKQERSTANAVLHW